MIPWRGSPTTMPLPPGEILEAVPRHAAGFQGAGHAAFCAESLELTAGGKLSTQCVMSWSAAAPVVSAWPSRASWRRMDFALFALGRKESDGLAGAIAGYDAGVLNFVPFDLSNIDASPS